MDIAALSDPQTDPGFRQDDTLGSGFGLVT
jgi:hypothetical protein